MEETTTTTATGSASKAARIVGWVLGVLPCLMLFFSAWMKLSKNPVAVDGFKQMGFPDGVALKIGLVELACTVLYLVPQTAVLGAILLTGYLGGATVTHVRVGEQWFTPVIVGVVLWLGLFLRDRRLRALVPFRR